MPRHLAIGSLRIADSAFRFSSAGSPREHAALECSFSQSGVLQPIVVAAFNGALQVMDGYQRIAWLQRQGETQVVAQVLDEHHSLAARLQLLLVLRESELQCAADRARFVALVQRLAPDDEALPLQIAQQLGLGAHSRLLRHCRAVDQLPAAALQLCVDKNFALKQCLRLTQHPREIIDTIFAWRDRLALTASIVEELAEGVAHLLKLREIELTTLLAEAEKAGALHTVGSAQEQTQRLRDWLRRQVYPRLSETNQQMQQIRTAMPLPATARLEWDSHLERRQLTLALTVTSLEAWRAALDELRSDAVDEGITSLLEAL